MPLEHTLGICREDALPLRIPRALHRRHEGLKVWVSGWVDHLAVAARQVEREQVWWQEQGRGQGLGGQR